MPIRLTSDENAFVVRVEGYCAERLSEPEMAAKEELSTSGLRDKLRRCGFEIEKTTSRQVVRVKSGETLAEIRADGELIVEPEAMPA